MNRMRVFGTIVLALTSFALLSAKERTKPAEYKGKVYTQIKIDDRGILLIDSLGNETEVPAGEFSERQVEVVEQRAREVERRVRDLERRGQIPGGEAPEAPGIPGTPFDENHVYTDTLDGIKKIGGTVRVNENEFVDGDVVVVGDAVISGRVSGSVTATGEVVLTSTGIVEGEITGRNVTEEPGSRAMGPINEQRISMPFARNWERDNRREDSTVAATVGVVMLMMLFLIVAGVGMIFPKPTDRVRNAYSNNIFKSLVVGFLVWILALPGFVILCITIIGIPVAIIGMPLAFVGAGFLGLASFCLFISEYVRSKNPSLQESRITKLALGFAILQLPTAGFFLGLIIHSEAMSIVFGILMGILFFIVTTASFGAAILTRFGTREPGTSSGSVSVRVEVAPTSTV